MTRRLVIALLALLPTVVAVAQESAPVTIDASPSAAEALRRAEEAANANPGESARLVQEVLERFGPRLVPWPPEIDRFRSAAAAAEDFLRTHPAVMERWMKQQAPVAERAVAQGEWIATVRTRGATPAALQALCALAQQAMDEGRPFEARAWIDRALRHPALDQAMRGRLQAAKGALRAPAEAPAAAVSAPGTAEQEWQPLWTDPLSTAWLNRRIAELDPAGAKRTIDAHVSDGSALSARPAFDGDAVLLADGAVVQSLDRFSGSVLWRALVGSERDRTTQPLGDLVVAKPIDDLVVTLPGHALPEQRSGAPRIVALERATGRVRWEANLGTTRRAEFEDLFPHGDPVGVGDLVVVQARKSNSRLESAAWLLALERRTGELRWSISLGAAGGVRLAASRPLGSPVSLGDDVIAATSLGVVTRVDAATGDVRWLRRWPAPIREPRTASPAWQLPSPVADASLVAWLAPDTATLVGLDPADGRTLFQLPIGVDTPLGAARTLLLGPDFLYAVGDDVVAIDRRDPSRIAWTLAKRLGAPVRLRGEVALGTLADGSPALAVPTAERLLLVSTPDGSTLGQAPIAGGGNLALDRGQLAVAAAQGLSIVMQAGEGERLLRERLAADPGDPRRGLALVELGRAWRRGALLLDGANAALTALPASDDARSVGVREDLLRKMLDPGLLAALEPAEAGRVLELAARLARTPDQRAQVLLCRADREQVDGRPDAARATLQSLLADAEVRRALIPVDLTRQVAAGVLALQRLAHSGEAGSIAELASLQRPFPEETLPSLGAPGTPVRTLPGYIVPESPAVEGGRPSDGVLLQETLALCMRRGPTLDVAWRVPFVGSESCVLSWGPSLVVWAPLGSEQGRVVSVDAASGAERWRLDEATRVFGVPLPTSSGDVVDRTEQRHVDALAVGSLVIVWRGDGRLVALHADRSGEPAWRQEPDSIHQLQAVAAHGGDIVCVGLPEAGSDAPRVEVRGASDGSVRLRGACPQAIGRPQWLQCVPKGVLIGGADGVALLEFEPDLPLRWQQLEQRVRGCDALACGGDWMLLADGNQRRVVAVQLADGSTRPDFLRSSDGTDANAFAGVRCLQGRWLSHRLLALTLHQPDGTLAGEAAGSPARRHDQVALSGDAVFSAEIVQPDAPRPFEGVDGRAAPTMMPRLAVRRFVTADGLRLAGPPLVLQAEGLRMTALDTVDGWLLIGCDDRTLALAAPTRPDSPR